MTNPQVVLVTGANRGIGQAICNLLITQCGVRPLTLLAASRRGANFLSATLRDGVQVEYPRLDVANGGSINTLADAVQQRYGGHVDVLINNAGVNLDLNAENGGHGYENARKTLEVNYWGTREMCLTFKPLLRSAGRVVNVSSTASSLGAYSDIIQRRFRNPTATLHDLDQLAEDYLISVRTGTEESSGFGPPGRSYNISKALVNAFTAILARDNPGLTINCCCPGWVSTDIGVRVGSGKRRPPKTVEQGAQIPLRLAFGDIGGVSGKYWANESVRSKGAGEVREW